MMPCPSPPGLKGTAETAEQICIPKKWLCDGDMDCEGGGDESEEMCKDASCSPDHFQCATGQPSAEAKLLDDNPSGNPRCIPRRWTCDGETDCRDGSDEAKELCLNRNCSSQQFRCEPAPPNDFEYCIPASWKCDGQRDCHGGEDERGCNSSAPDWHGAASPQALSLCLPNEFRCHNGNCIFKDWTCDFDDDCGDQSDESPANTKCHGILRCKDGYFECRSNKYCVPERWLCDGEQDCQDSSDETHPNCTHGAAATPIHHAQCGPQEFQCHTGGCIHKEWKCDRDPDCPDNSDEADCPLDHQCDSPDKVRCGDDKHKQHKDVCIPTWKMCDGSNDCPEWKEGGTSMYYDELPDICLSGDNHNAQRRELGCHEDEWRCHNTNHTFCIPYHSLCDNAPDCPHAATAIASDEDPKTCDALASPNNCSENNGGCQQVCHQLGAGVICTCHSGWTIDSADPSRCSDFADCTRPGTCSQLCIPSEKAGIPHRCACHHGYMLQADRKSCRALGPFSPKLLISNRANIREVDLRTREYLPLVENLHSAVAMDFIYQKKQIIWSDVAAEKIKHCNVSSELLTFTREKPGAGEWDAEKISETAKTVCQERILVEHNVSTPDGLAVDWAHELLFWTDTGHNTISVIDLKKPENRRTLFNSSLDEPRAIAVDPKAALIFWTDWGQEPKIERANMDGTGRRTIVRKELAWPNGLALDLLAKRIYWADAKLKLIASCDYEGRDRRTVLQSVATLKHPFSLSVFEDKLYWTDWDTEGVHAVNKFTGRGVEVIAHGLYGPMTVRVFHAQSQPALVNKCSNHRCHHLCLPRATHYSGLLTEDRFDESAYASKRIQAALDARDSRRSPFVCHCRDGYELGEDGKTCTALRPASLLSPFLINVLIALLLCTLIALVILGIVLYRRGYHNIHVPFNFDNPVYRRTVEEEASEWDNGSVRFDSDFHDIPPTSAANPPPMPPPHASPPPRLHYNEGAKALLTENEVA